MSRKPRPAPRPSREGAVDAEIVEALKAQGVSPEQIESVRDQIADMPMPTVENAKTYVFVPTAGCSIPDVVEIVLMMLLNMTKTPLDFEPGTLRRLGLLAASVEKLSPEARRFMVEAATPMTTDSNSHPQPQP